MAITVLELIDYARQQLKPLPADRWKGSGNGKALNVKEHRIGLDASRGPWVKFQFTFEGEAQVYEVQGYKTWKRGDRIKFGPAGAMKECEDDDLEFRAALNLEEVSGDVIVKFSFEQNESAHSLRFAGKMAKP
jgi:hypothetical protein